MARIVALTLILMSSLQLSVGQNNMPQASPIDKCDVQNTCTHRYVNGELLNTITGPSGVAVTAALDESRDSKYFRVRIGVVNGSDKTFDLLPEGFLLEALGRKAKTMKPIPPDEIEKAALRQNFWSNYLIAVTANLSRDKITTKSNTNAQTSGNVSIYGPNGSMASGTYTESGSSSTTATTSIPDYAARARADEAIRSRNALVAAQNAQVAQTALRANTLAPGERVAGTVYMCMC